MLFRSLAVTLIGLALGLIAWVLRYPLLHIYSDTEAVVEAALIRLRIIAFTYFLCGIMDVLCGALRGLGSTIAPMVVSILGACALRIFWIYAILPMNRTLTMLYISYPVSWIITAAVHGICYVHKLKIFPVTANTTE